MEAGTRWAQRFRVVRRLGSGGAGSVWEAEDERLGRTVAIKQLHLPSGPTSRRFQREARLGASLRHPGLVTVYDILCEDHVVLLVMEHVGGGSLAERFAGGPPPRDGLLGWLRDVAAALDHAHAHGIIHRDVKPANILIARDGRAKLADLGIAMAVESTRLTAQGELLGTPAYLAPELLDGAAASPASDVYALAAVAFEGLTGRRAHAGRNAMEILRHVRTDPAPDLAAAWPEASPATAAVVTAGMAARPEDRPPTATRFVEELELALRRPAPPPPAPVARERATAARPAPPVPDAAARRERPTGVRPPAALHRGRSRRTPVLAALALLLVAGAIAAIVAGGGSSGESGGSAGSAGRQDDTSGGGAATGAEDEEGGTAGAGGGEAATTATATATATPAPAGSGSGRPGRSPKTAVRGFYELAAAGDFDGAWALAGPRMRAAFGDSVATFEAELSSLESITFDELAVSDRTPTSATVTVRTTARHTDRTDTCSGPLRTTKGTDGVWRVDPVGIRCTSA